MVYKLLEASNEHGAGYAMEELETKVNRLASKGYRLKTKSLQVSREDRGDYAVPMYRVVAVMYKKDDDKKKEENARK